MVNVNQLGGIISILAIILIIFLVYFNHYEKFKPKLTLKISVSEAKARRFGLIIDVRTLKERELGYYPNSIPISPQILEQQVPLDISNKNTWILVYSNRDNRAENAAQKLHSKGYRNVRYIDETYLSLMPGSN